MTDSGPGPARAQTLATSQYHPASTSLKRFACDRCRGQKLRCPRPDDDITTACTRCVRCRVRCVTSASKPPGRPAANRQLDNDGPARAWATGQHQQRHQQTPLVQPQTLLLSPRDVLVDHDPAAMPISSGHMFLPERGDGHLELELRDAANSHHNHTGGLFDFSVDSDAILLGASGLFDSHLHRQTFPTPTSSSATTTPVAEMMRSDASPSSPAEQCSGSVTSMTQNSRPELLLATLHQKLARRLALVETAPPDVGQLTILTFIEGICSGERTNSAPEDVPEVNHLSTILRHTSDFLHLCRLFKDPTTSVNATPSPHQSDDVTMSNASGRDGGSYHGHHGHRRQSSSTMQPGSWHRPTSPPNLSIATLLTLLSCYLQLVSIYEAIFSRISCVTDDGAAGITVSGGGNTAVPAMMHRRLSLRLLVQVFEYYLEQLEDALGLPSMYRVTRSGVPMEEGEESRVGDGESAEGLLAAREGSALVVAAMGHRTMEGVESEEGDGGGDSGGGGLAAVELLRSSMRRVYSSGDGSVESSPELKQRA